VEIQTITDRSALEEYFRQDLPLHLYSLGDLDDFYWPRVTVYGTGDGKGLKNITPLYRGEEPPVLLAFGQLDQEYISALQPLLPEAFYAHLGPGLAVQFHNGYQIKDYGGHYKMVLADSRMVDELNTDNTFPLTGIDLPEIIQLYEESYPDTAFNTRMLQTGQYFGIRLGGQLISIAGIHVYSARYRAAALGNITTLPQHRGRGYGRAVTARLCQQLRENVDIIGLNVKCGNKPALALYHSLGFRICAEYGEFSLQKRA